jgi:hypothetical protein
MMEEKIRNALKLAGPFMPASVKVLLLEVGAELDRLRAEVDKLRSGKMEN